MAPTLTDANLVLGRIDPEYFLGGEIKLDPSAAREAISRDCAAPLSMSVEDAARGIVDIANANMVRALRLVTVQRGRDPRNFVLVAFGGAGPLHASSLASELQIPTIVIPPSPGVFSAAGLLLAEIQNVVTTTRIQPLGELTDDEIRRSFARLDEQAEAGLEEQGVARHGITLRRFADMRYRGQSYELSIPLPDTQDDLISHLTEQFLAEHARQYGHSTRDGVIEVVNWKVYAVAASTRTPGSRPVNLGRETGGVASSTLANATSARRGELPMNTPMAGPLIIADEDSTTYVEDGWTAERDSEDIITLRRPT